MAVQLEVDIPVERRNVGDSLQPPVLPAQTVDGDDRISNLQRKTLSVRSYRGVRMLPWQS